MHNLIKMTKGIYQNLPPTPGVYIMKNGKGEILYIGKAVNLKRRVSSYFLRTNNYRIEKLVSQIKKINYKKTDTGLEALILESELIKKHQPPFNVLEKDDRSFLYVEIAKEKFPRVLLVRGKDSTSNISRQTSSIFGPFISASAIREAIKIVRRIFPFSVHDPKTLLASGHTLNPKPCFDYSLGLCPGTCIGAVSQKEYAKNIRNIKLFFSGKKKRILESLKKEMKILSKNLEFEKAEKTKRQIFAFQHIQDTAFISEDLILKPKTYDLKPSLRIEGYDISNISGTSAVGSMVVFSAKEGNFRPQKSDYRKFKIYSVKGPNDTGMIKEILSRRLKHQEWPLPDLILIDGGRGQINAVKAALAEANLKIPVIGIAKGSKRNKNEFHGDIRPQFYKPIHQTSDRKNSVSRPSELKSSVHIERKVLIQVRDEAHRFAIRYHKKFRKRNFLALLQKTMGVNP